MDAYSKMINESGNSLFIREIRPEEEEIARDVFYAALDAVDIKLKEKHRRPDGDLMDIRKWYTDAPGNIFLVGLVGDKIVATGALTRIDDHRVKLRRMSVAPAYQGFGYGIQMLHELEFIAQRLAYREIILDTASILVSAIGMYTRAGYVETQREDVGGGIQLVYFSKKLR